MWFTTLWTLAIRFHCGTLDSCRPQRKLATREMMKNNRNCACSKQIVDYLHHIHAYLITICIANLPFRYTFESFIYKKTTKYLCWLTIFHYLCRRKAALGNLKVNFHCSHWHSHCWGFPVPVSPARWYGLWCQVFRQVVLWTFFLYILIISRLCFWHSRCLAILQQIRIVTT